MKIRMIVMFLLLVAGCVAKTHSSQCINRYDCPTNLNRLEQRMCDMKYKTVSGEITWTRSNGVTEPFFVFGSSDAMFILRSKGATLTLGHIINDETFDINDDCARDLYQYLLNTTKDQAAQKREQALNEFLNGPGSKQ